MRLKFLIWLIIFPAFLFLPSASFAGLKWVDVGVNGLTCSMCSRSVEMGLMRLDFIDRVAMSLETTEGRIFFKPGAPIDLNEISKAVVNAGFSVRFVKLQITFDDIPLQEDGSFVLYGQLVKWMHFRHYVEGPVALTLLGESFLPKKEYTAWKKKIAESKPGDEKILHVVQQG